jgi:uncharacterized membrane protein
MNTGSSTYGQRATKSAGRGGHPIHPPLTDVTIGAYTFAAIAAVLGELDVARHGFVQAWWLALLVGAGSSVLTELAGFLDWRTISSRTLSKRTATLHAATMASASVVFVLAIVFGQDDYVARSLDTGSLILTLVGFVLLVAGGAIGGSLVFVHGMRVSAEPRATRLRDSPAIETYRAGDPEARAMHEAGVERGA